MKRSTLTVAVLILPMVLLALLALPGCVFDPGHDHGGWQGHEDHHDEHHGDDHGDFDHH